jgi:hypothetical protein
MLIYQGAAAPCTTALGVDKLPHWKLVSSEIWPSRNIWPFWKYGMPLLLSGIGLSEILRLKKLSSEKSHGAYNTCVLHIPLACKAMR